MYTSRVLVPTLPRVVNSFLPFLVGNPACSVHERPCVLMSATLEARRLSCYPWNMLESLDQLDRQESFPSSSIFESLIKECSNSKDLAEGKRVHAHIIKSGRSTDLILCNLLILMYNKCESIIDARQVFDRMPVRTVSSWNLMVSGYSRHGNLEDAFKLLQQMQHENVKSNKITFINILNAFASTARLALGKLVHALIIDEGLHLDMLVGTALLNMYGKCGSIVGAFTLFNKLPERDVVSWNSMLGLFIYHGYTVEALKLFHQMQQEGLKPTIVTFTIILKIFANREDLALGRVIHSHILDVGLISDKFLQNALVNMYGKCGSLKDAQSMFDRMPERYIITWNAMIAAYIKHGLNKEALKLFHQMEYEGFKCDKFTFIIILDVCGRPESLPQGKVIHARIIEIGFEWDDIVRNALVTMYGKCGSVKNARRVFDKIPERTVVSWNAMIGAYMQHGYDEEAFKIFLRMQQEGMRPNKVTLISILNACVSPETFALGKLVHAQIIDGVQPDVVVETALVNMYLKCGSIKHARRIFDRMPVRNVVTWTAIIARYSSCGYSGEAFNIFQLMQQEGVRPDKASIISILNTCASIEALALGKLIHTHIVDSGFESDITVGNALVTMYGRCGSIKDARMMFDTMPEQDVISWNAMIMAYTQHGYGREGLQMFQKMQINGLTPNKVTMLNVLNACAHTGLVDKGLSLFNSMSEDYGITPALEHYNCVVDVLSRAGWLDEAEDFINKMPIQPDAVVWMTLLGSCKVYGCIELGKQAAEQALQLDPKFAPVYAVLANMYAAVGRWNEATMVRKLMADMTVSKESDRSHPQMEEIYPEWRVRVNK